MTSMRSAAVGLLVLCIVLVQVAIPALALLEPRPSRFGWQMYTAAAPHPAVELESRNGQLESIDVVTIVADGRGEIRWAQHFARALCGDDIAAVIVVDRDGRSRWICD